MGLSDFLMKYGRSASLIFGGAAVSYFLVYHSSLTPPLKPREAIFGMSVIVEAYAILTAMNSKKLGVVPPTKLMLCSALVYFLSLFSLTFLVPTSPSNYRDAVGFVCKRQFIELYGDTCFWIGQEVLEKALFEPNRIWESWSIYFVRTYLCAVWLLLVWTLSSCVAISVRANAR
jgi:hypothetical protein